MNKGEAPFREGWRGGVMFRVEFIGSFRSLQIVHNML
jgi:hypothetical protein